MIIMMGVTRDTVVKLKLAIVMVICAIQVME